MASLLALPKIPPSFQQHALGWRQVRPPDTLDSPLLNFPRGRITEVAGARSSGRTTILHALLAASTSLDEHAVLVDTNDTFDPSSAAAAGVRLAKLIWIRCAGNAE